MNDVATQIETNTKTMMILFDERKERILELMAMVEKTHKIAVAQLEQNLTLIAEIMRLRANAPEKKIRSKLRSSQHSFRRINTRTRSTHILKEEVDR
jgi:hypothetical protein